ncbi:universal stress protein [Natribaculum luteum]|uniref:Universal stress protein n=1 Tax=Natribaculum luteum TaxID=1586232 RepID=A0ABD5NYR9_9EURY|nr:universal stress protein [Natribaculum luteum]
MERILVAMDGSSQSHHALEYALETFPGATIQVVHVPEVVEFPLDTGTDPYDLALERADDVFDEAQKIADEYGRSVETDTTNGHPAKAVIAYADDHDVDAIVVGSRGRTGATRLLLGSVAETIVRRANCPVTVVR